MTESTRLLLFAGFASMLLGCSVYRSSDRDDFDSKGASRAGITSFAYSDLCSVISLPKGLLNGVDQLTVLPSLSNDAAVSRCSYKAIGKADSLRTLSCELAHHETAPTEQEPTELGDDSDETTFRARSSTGSGFLKCSISFDGMSDLRDTQSYDRMSRQFALFFKDLTSTLSE